jgi:hypothetical protein
MDVRLSGLKALLNKKIILILLKESKESKQFTLHIFEPLMAVSSKTAVFWVVGSVIRADVLMKEAEETFETLVNLYQTTGSYNPEDSHLSYTLLIL